MEIPKFAVGNFDVRIAGADPGVAFQQFAGEVLRVRYPQLHTFPAGGRDGAIDLVDQSSRTVFECKYSSDGNLKRAMIPVREHLRTHLSPDDAPSQSQYAPWYANNGEPISRYVVVTNHEFVNEGGLSAYRAELRDDMRAFFKELSAREHLRHLGDIEVDVIDGSDVRTLLHTRPALVFRWFPSTRPNGLTLLDEASETRGFRTFLNQSTLPYYSRADHLAATGASTFSAAAEQSVLGKLETATGLIITGKGGVGKTRLTLELGRQARKGWLVLRASPGFRDEALDEVVARLSEPTNILILVDYVELIAGFADRVEHIEALNATVPHRIRYVANCRTSYYRNLQTVGGHERIDITPAAGETSQWLEDYRRAVVERILAGSGIELTPAHIQVCRDTPVFAVFMAYLQRLKRTDDLNDLLEDGEFGRWVARRAQQSFQRNIGSELATLFACFPIPDDTYRQLPASSRDLFQRLADDGWIELLTEGPETGSWVTAHDALADRVMINHMESLGTPHLFIEEALAFAEEHDLLGSMLISLQRVGDTPSLQGVDWVSVFSSHMLRTPEKWNSARRLLLRSNLLQPLQRLALMDRSTDQWQDQIGDVDLQNVLGWICRCVAEGTEKANALQMERLRHWVLRAAASIGPSNYLLTYGLSLLPELRGCVQAWLETHPAEFQTHFLLVAWLKRGFLASEINAEVLAWATAFRTNRHFSFLIRAWLNADGDPQLLANHIVTWLSIHGGTIESPFVYRAWLEATRDRTLVEDHIRRWLKLHCETDEARFVYSSWLDATGDRTLVEDHIRRWLPIHGEIPEAEFVYRSWLDATRDRTLVEDHIRRWLTIHDQIIEAQFIYTSWLDTTRDRTLVEDHIRRWLMIHGELPDARFVYRAWLNATRDGTLVEDHIRRWLKSHGEILQAPFVYTSWLDATRDRTLVEDHVLRWLTIHGEELEAQFVYRAWLDATRDRSLVEDHIRHWLTLHHETSEAQFVYRAWLDATQDHTLIEDHFRRWLTIHGEGSEAQFVYRAWLDANGPLEEFESRIITWIKHFHDSSDLDFLLVAYLKHGGTLAAVADEVGPSMTRLLKSPDGAFLSKTLARQKELPPDLVKAVLLWCREFRTDEDALWRLSQIAFKATHAKVIVEWVEACQYVLDPWLDPNSGIDQAKAVTITKLLSLLTYDARDPQVQEQIDQMLVRWLRHPDSFQEQPVPNFLQRKKLVARIHGLVGHDRFDLPQDDEALRKFARWVLRWDSEQFRRIDPLPAWIALMR